MSRPSLPSRGQQNWDGALNDVLNDVRTSADASDTALAGRLSESGLSATFVAHDQVGYGTKRGIYATGCQGTTTASALTTGDYSERLVVRLPVSPIRFRIKLRNYDTIGGAAQTALPGEGIFIGLGAYNSDGSDTGNVSGSFTQLVASGAYTIPGDGTWYTSPWFDQSAFTIPELTNIIVAHGFTVPSAINVPRGIGQAWGVANNTYLTAATATTGLPLSGTPVEMQIEYDFDSDRAVGLFIGDSIMEGLGGSSSTGNPLFRSWPALWAAREHAVSVVAAAAGTTSASWAGGSTGRLWKRLDLSSIDPDFVVIGLGANDANSSIALATFQGNMASVVGSVRTLFGADIPVYLVNVTPRGYTVGSTQETDRLAYNNWLESQPLRSLVCFDFDAAVRDPAATNQLLGAPTNNNVYNYDGTHFTGRGYNKLAQSMGRVWR